MLTSKHSVYLRIICDIIWAIIFIITYVLNVKVKYSKFSHTCQLAISLGYYNKVNLTITLFFFARLHGSNRITAEIFDRH